MDEFYQYLATLIKTMEAGTMENFATPADPGDLGTPLTQEEIDWVKKLKKEIEERFTEA